MSSAPETIDEQQLPEDLIRLKPIEPLPSDCCGSGCTLCVFDIYEQELKIWKKECKKYFLKDKASNEKESDAENVICQEEYSKFTLKNIIKETVNSSIYRFNISNNRKLGIKMGQHLILRDSFNNEWITRQYTPISPVDTEGHFDVLIKLYEHGKMSKCIHQWKINDKISWRGPFGDFQYKPNSFSQIIMLVAGSGITPVVEVIRQILDNEDDETFLCLFYACRYYDDIMLKTKLKSWESYWNFTVVYCLSQESDKTKKKYGDKIHYGRIHKDLILKEMKFKVKDIFVLICGSFSFNNDMKNIINQLRIQNHFIF
ncbi:NADH-cytochrome b5 reductase-like [Centruroides sculpturatus]|uniref:NADH-cytochrome b5 reductase-like n=1 Tax=Centruroides sculpturatus TaxID=218467 RepID=UPI000C6DFC77|nr:NADH-cytochrome b5 reductase-like [Centruroides sculpturatus]